MDKTYSSSDKRQFKRIKVNFAVFYKVDRPLYVRMLVGNQEVNAIMLDLSESGMCISTNYSIPTSTLLLIKFTLINEAAINEERVRAMEIEGRIRYCRFIEKGEYRLGICFTYISKDGRLSIADFVKMASFKSQS